MDFTLIICIIIYCTLLVQNDPEVYKYMKSYSPVDNVAAVAYPNIFVTGMFQNTETIMHESTTLPYSWAA